MSAEACVECPYVGLVPFEPAHADYFFGRRLNSAVIAENVLTRPLTVLYGASGTGKSSVLNVGVPRALEDLGVTPHIVKRREWHRADTLVPWLQDTISGAPRASREAQQPLILILDQFEEFFLYPSAKQIKEFGRLLGTLATRTDIEAHVLFSLRDDGLHRLDALRMFMPCVLDNTLELRHLDESGVREAIEKPVAVWNKQHGKHVDIDADFAASLIDQLRPRDKEGKPVENGQIELAFLQLALERIWEEEGGAARAKAVRTSTLNQRLKGVREIARRHVEQVVEKLKEPDKDLCATIFDRLVTPSGGKILYASGDLAAVARADPGHMEEVLAALASGNSRILRGVDLPESGGMKGYEILHDVLARPILDWTADRTTRLEARIQRTRAEQAENDRERLAKLRNMLTALSAMLFVAGGYVWHAASRAQEANEQVVKAFETTKVAQEETKQALANANEARAKLEASLKSESEYREQAEDALTQARKAQALANRHRNDAVRERNLRASYLLTVAARGEVSRNSDLAVLLALEALPLAQSPESMKEAMNVLRDALESTRIQLTPAAGGGHTSAVRGVAIDSARNRLATASDDSTVKVWDMESGKEITLRGHGGQVLSVAFSADGRVASGSYDDTARLWDASSGKELRRFSGHRDTITSVALSNDGKFLATGSEDRTAKLWDTETGRDLQTFRGHTGIVRSVALSPDGKVLATAGDDGAAKLWDVGSGRESLSLSGHARPVTAVAFSHDGTRLATGSDDRLVKLWDVKSGKELKIFRGHTNSIRAVVFDAGSTRIATGGADNTARLWDVDTGKQVARFDHTDAINSVALNREGTRLAGGSADRTARLWDTSTPGKAISTFGSPAVTQVAAATFSPDASRVATISGEYVVVWDSVSGAETGRISQPGGKPQAIAFSPDGRALATGGTDRIPRIWDVNDLGKAPRALADHGRPIRAIAFSHDGTRLAATSANDTVTVSDIQSGQELFVLQGHTATVSSIAFSENGRYISTGSFDNAAKTWDASTGKLLRTFIGHNDWVNTVAFSPDSRRLATGSDDRSAKVWDVNDERKELAVMTGHTSAVQNVGFVTIGQNVYLATTSGDRTARLWDTKTGKEEQALRGHTNTVQDLAVHPGKKVILTTGADRTVRTHPQTDADLVDLARARVRRQLSAEECAKFQVSGKSCELARLAAEGSKHITEKKYREAIAAFDRVQAIDPKRISATEWNELCWQASLGGAASLVVDGACEKAVTLSKGNPLASHYADSRGLARALTGRTSAAISDFDVFVRDPQVSAEHRNQRQSWIADLKAGRNPFSQEVLKDLQ